MAPAAGSAERWLRRVFIKDWSLKLLALAITLSLWFVVTVQRSTVRQQVRGVHLTFRTHQDMEISNDPRDEVKVTISGPDEDLDQIRARELVAVVDVTDRNPGERVISLTPGNVQISLPDKFHLDSIEPNSMVLKLEPRIERELIVEPRIEGRPADGFALKQVVVNPQRVRVQGPASHVNALQKAATETISIEGRRESFNLPRTAIYVPDPKVDVVETVNIHVEIVASGSPKRKSRESN